MEIWRQHPIYTNYEASYNGEIRNNNWRGLGRVRNVKQTLTDGYYKFKCDGKNRYSARFIWECFNGLIPDGMEIDHINTITTDNSLTNLRMCSHKDNLNNPITLEHMSSNNGRWNKGLHHTEATKKKISDGVKRYYNRVD